MTSNEYSFEQDYNEAMDTINSCLIRLGKRLEDLEKHVQEIPTPDKTYYKPKGYEDYLDMRQNYDELYKRITKLEEMTHPRFDYESKTFIKSKGIPAAEDIG